MPPPGLRQSRLLPSVSVLMPAWFLKCKTSLHVLLSNGIRDLYAPTRRSAASCRSAAQAESVRRACGERAERRSTARSRIVGLCERAGGHCTSRRAGCLRACAPGEDAWCLRRVWCLLTELDMKKQRNEAVCQAGRAGGGADRAGAGVRRVGVCGFRAGGARAGREMTEAWCD